MAPRRRKQEEKFEIRKKSSYRSRIRYRTPAPPISRKKRKNKIAAEWDRLTEGWVGAIVYVFLGIGLALVTKQVLAVGLSSDMPVVAVVSPSMQHNNADITHYKWLETNLGYSEEYINSWPIPNGFMVGDMPIVKGEDEYNLGDVIVYSVPTQQFPIIHRIIKINEDGTHQTKGDNNINQLPYEFSVRKEQIYGKVVFVIPKLGYFKVIVTKLFSAV